MQVLAMQWNRERYVCRARPSELSQPLASDLWDRRKDVAIFQVPFSSTTITHLHYAPAASNYAAWRAAGYTDKWSRPAAWSDEERRLLVRGLRDMHAHKLHADTKDKFAWLAHHVMELRRTRAEVRRAVNAINQQHDDWAVATAEAKSDFPYLPYVPFRDTLDLFSRLFCV